MDGLRSYYARTEGDNADAVSSALCAMSLLMSVNVVCLTAFLDVALHGTFVWVSWISDHKLLALPLPISILVLNYFLAKTFGIYGRRGTQAARNWKPHFISYVVTSALLFVIFLVLAMMLRP